MDSNFSVEVKKKTPKLSPPLSLPTFRQTPDIIRNEVNSQPGIYKVDKIDY